MGGRGQAAHRPPASFRTASAARTAWRGPQLGQLAYDGFTPSQIPPSPTTSACATGHRHSRHGGLVPRSARQSLLNRAIGGQAAPTQSRSALIRIPRRRWSCGSRRGRTRAALAAHSSISRFSSSTLRIAQGSDTRMRAGPAADYDSCTADSACCQANICKGRIGKSKDVAGASNSTLQGRGQGSYHTTTDHQSTTNRNCKQESATERRMSRP